MKKITTKNITWILMAIMAALIIVSGCSSGDNAGSGDSSHLDSSNDYMPSYPSGEDGYYLGDIDSGDVSGYDYDYERQAEIEEIRQRNQEEIERLEEENWERQTNRLVDDMDY
jgi:hypothetical protein